MVVLRGDFRLPLMLCLAKVKITQFYQEKIPHYIFKSSSQIDKYGFVENTQSGGSSSSLAKKDLLIKGQ
jgi:hypothetical protein